MMKAKYPERAGRLREFFKHLNISNKEASSKLGYDRPAYVSQLLNQHSTITASVVYRLANAYPNLNPKWLLDGEGEMLLDKKNDLVEEPTVAYGNEPTREQVEELYAAVLARFRPDPPLGLKQELTLRLACHRVLSDNAGVPFASAVVGAGVYLRFIQAYPDLSIPPALAGPGSENR